MEQESAQSREEWNCLAVLVSLLGGMALQSIALPSLCYQGTVNMWAAGAVDILVIVRLAIARVCHEKGKGWIVYASLPYVIVPILLVVGHIACESH